MLGAEVVVFLSAYYPLFILTRRTIILLNLNWSLDMGSPRKLQTVHYCAVIAYLRNWPLYSTSNYSRTLVNNKALLYRCIMIIKIRLSPKKISHSISGHNSSVDVQIIFYNLVIVKTVKIIFNNIIHKKKTI